MEGIYVKGRNYVKETEIKRCIAEYSSKKSRSLYSDVEFELITTKECKTKNKLILLAIEFFPDIIGFLVLVTGGPILMLTNNSLIVIPYLIIMLVVLLIMMKMVICRNDIKESQDKCTTESIHDAEKHENWHAEILNANNVGCNLIIIPNPVTIPNDIISKELCLKALLNPLFKGISDIEEKPTMRVVKALTFSKSDIFFFFKILLNFRCIAVGYPSATEMTMYLKVK